MHRTQKSDIKETVRVEHLKASHWIKLVAEYYHLIAFTWGKLQPLSCQKCCTRICGVLMFWCSLFQNYLT